MARPAAWPGQSYSLLASLLQGAGEAAGWQYLQARATLFRLARWAEQSLPCTGPGMARPGGGAPPMPPRRRLEWGPQRAAPSPEGFRKVERFERRRANSTCPGTSDSEGRAESGGIDQGNAATISAAAWGAPHHRAYCVAVRPELVAPAPIVCCAGVGYGRLQRRANSTCPGTSAPEGRAESGGFDEGNAAAVSAAAWGAPHRRAGCVAVRQGFYAHAC